MPAAVGRCVGTSIFRHWDVGDVCDGRRWVVMGGDGRRWAVWYTIVTRD